MIITDKIEIIVNNKQVKYYTSLGYNIKGGDKITIPVNHLMKNSRIRIDVECENCHSIQNLSYQKYNMNVDRGGVYYCKKCNNITFKKSFNEKYNVDNPLQLDWVKDKIRNTVSTEYGVDWITKTQEVKDKVRNTFIINYGGHPMKTKEILDKVTDIKIKNNTIRFYDLEKLIDYRKRVMNVTEKNKKILFNNWDGYDYYDGEDIKEYLTLHQYNRLCPNVDHKISISYGFKNNIDINIIADISNLCITKKYLNILKSGKTDSEFKTFLESQTH